MDGYDTSLYFYMDVNIPPIVPDFFSVSHCFFVGGGGLDDGRIRKSYRVSRWEPDGMLGTAMAAMGFSGDQGIPSTLG